MKARTFIVADDDLSRLIRTVEPRESSSDGPSRPPRKPVEKVLEGLLTWLCDQLTGMGWPDPTACLVFRNGEWTDEAIDPLKLHLREQETGVEYVPSATAIRHDLESRGLAFEDAWYCAAMVDNLLAALAGPDDQRPYAMIAVGWWLRDWEWRRKYGKKARGKLRQERAQPKAVEARKQKAASDPPDWWEDARKLATGLMGKNRKRTAWDIAGEIAPELGYSRRQVHKIIRPLWK